MKGAIILALLAALAPSRAGAAAYPEKPVRIIVALAPGGPADGAARALAEPLSRALGQPVVIENKPGANGVIAAEAVRNAPPDGYTLLWGQPTVLIGVPLTHKGPTFDTVADFTPLSLVGRFALCVVSHPDVPATTLQQFVDYAHANPRMLNYGTNSITEDIVAAQISKSAGLVMVRVPYKGGTSQMPDLLAGRVQLGFTSCAVGLPHVREGRLRVLATLLPNRSPAAPGVPTIAEAGFPQATVTAWFGLFAPAGLPKDVADRLSREVNLALQHPDLRAQLERYVVRPEGSTPQGLAALLAQDLKTWRQIVSETGIAE
jgi:tripartite-type tricarboxylate transporter receptor subunit TctC